MTIALLLAGLLAAESATPGFSATELARQTTSGDVVEIRSALARSEAVRAALIVDPARSPAIIAPMEAQALNAALGELDPASAAQISWFMRGAVTRVAPAARGTAMVAGYYNPLVDLWLVARLAQIDGEWRIARARLLDGAAMRGGGTLWSDAPADAFAALTDNYGRSLAAFDRRFQRVSRAPLPRADAFALLAARTHQWIGSLAAWRQDAGALAAAERVREAIAEARLSRSDIADRDLARQIDGLPIAIRGTYAITGAARRGDAVSLILVSPMAPELLLVLDLDAADRPRSIAVVNLGNASSAGGSR